MRATDRAVHLTVVSLTAACAVTGIGHALAQSVPLAGDAAFGDWRGDKPGVRRLIRPEDLPRPGATPSTANVSRVVRRLPASIPQVPAGFAVELFAEGLSGPRQMRVAPNGDIFVAETAAGRVRVLRASDGDSRPSISEVYASGLDRPFGIAFFPHGDNPQWVYVANTSGVVRFLYHAGDLKAAQRPETVVAELPHDYGHSTRDIVFTRAGVRSRRKAPRRLCHRNPQLRGARGSSRQR